MDGVSRKVMKASKIGENYQCGSRSWSKVKAKAQRRISVDDDDFIMKSGQGLEITVSKL